MAINVEITIDSFGTTLGAINIVIPCRFRTVANMQLFSLSVTLGQVGLNPSNWVSQFKAAASAALLADYALAHGANDIMVYGAPQ